MSDPNRRGRWARLLWRVRWRLVITYLFVGLTPIVLMAAHSAISSFGLSMETMARILTVRTQAALEEAESFTRAIADEINRLPDAAGDADHEGPGEAAIDVALARGAALLATSLPGTRLERVDPASLPSWVAWRSSWSGVVRRAPGEDGDPGAGLEVRALAHAGPPGREFAVLLRAPIGEPFAAILGRATDMRVRPASPGSGRIVLLGRLSATGLFYTVSLPASDWRSGEVSDTPALTFDWSWAESGRQIFGSSTAGRSWRLALILLGFVFLALELGALGAAAWMVSAVTSTVDRLHRATTFIGRGDFSHRIAVRSDDQLGELARHFNDMSAHIEELLHERLRRERLEREVTIAAQVQARLFPRHTPEIRTLELTGECRAARGVAGDYYDYLDVGEGRAAFALGDVAGKGISASLLMSNLQASLRAQAPLLGAVAPPGDGGTPVADMMARLNRQLCASIEDNRFASLILALYDERDRSLRYTNAGHNPGILVRPDGATEALRAGGAVLGVFRGALYGEQTAGLFPGSLILLYSDGISEARAPGGEEYGEGRLVDFAVRHRALTACEMRTALFQEIDAWTAQGEREDDQTLVILKVRDSPA